MHLPEHTSLRQHIHVYPCTYLNIQHSDNTSTSIHAHTWTYSTQTTHPRLSMHLPEHTALRQHIHVYPCTYLNTQHSDNTSTSIHAHTWTYSTHRAHPRLSMHMPEHTALRQHVHVYTYTYLNIQHSDNTFTSIHAPTWTYNTQTAHPRLSSSSLVPPWRTLDTPCKVYAAFQFGSMTTPPRNSSLNGPRTPPTRYLCSPVHDISPLDDHLCQVYPYTTQTLCRRCWFWLLNPLPCCPTYWNHV